MQTIEGKLRADGSVRIGIVVSRFNEVICKSLLDGAIDTLVRHGVDDSNITVVKVPGAFEIPIATSKMAESGNYDAVVCLGAVIRGSTGHYEYVAGQAASGIAQVALQSGIPVGFGVLTTETIEQAVERAGSKAGNKGSDAALAVLEMVDLLKQL
jgi:6,7-dimethyl-8-ribityllumazine synthase